MPPPKAKKKSREVEHKSLSSTALQELVDNDISHVGNIIGMEVQHIS